MVHAAQEEHPNSTYPQTAIACERATLRATRTERITWQNIHVFAFFEKIEKKSLVGVIRYTGYRVISAPFPQSQIVLVQNHCLVHSPSLF